MPARTERTATCLWYHVRCLILARALDLVSDRWSLSSSSAATGTASCSAVAIQAATNRTSWANRLKNSIEHDHWPEDRCGWIAAERADQDSSLRIARPASPIAPSSAPRRNDGPRFAGFRKHRVEIHEDQPAGANREHDRRYIRSTGAIQRLITESEPSRRLCPQARWTVMRDRSSRPCRAAAQAG